MPSIVDRDDRLDLDGNIARQRAHADRGYLAGAGGRRRFADSLARERRRLLAGEGVLRHDGAANLQDVDGLRNDHFGNGVAVDAGSFDGDLSVVSTR